MSRRRRVRTARRPLVMKEDNPMDELVKLVSQKTGLAEDKARDAVMTVLGFLKERLPAPIAGQLDGLLGGAGSGMQDMAKGLGGMLDRK
jgi:hypothetical protein